MEAKAVLFDCDPELWKLVKIQAIKEGKTVSEWVSEVLQNALNHK